MPAPDFIPSPTPLSAFVAFVLTPGAGWGAELAAIQGDDFDDVLAAIPPDVVAWHIYARDTGYVVAGSNPEHDRTHPGTAQEDGDDPEGPHDRAPVDKLVIFRRREDAWGAWCAALTTDNPLAVRDGDQILDTVSSTVITGSGVARVIPTLDQLAEYEGVVAEWQMEEEARGRPQQVDPAVEARAKVFMQQAVLPEGWESLPTDALRKVVEDAEKAVFEATGKTPEQIRAERELHERALSNTIEEVGSEPDI